MIEDEDITDDSDAGRGLAERPHQGKRLIGFGHAMASYGVLAVVSVLTLKGSFLIFALIVVGAIALLTYTQHLREKLDD